MFKTKGITNSNNLNNSIIPKWRNYAKSGHTDCKPMTPIQTRLLTFNW